MKIKVTISLTILALVISGCSTGTNFNSVKMEHKLSTVLTSNEINEFEKEYSAFKTKSLSQAYLERKLNQWLTTGNDEKLLKELLYAKFKYPTLAQSFFADNREKQMEMQTITLISERMAIDSPFAAFMNYTPTPTGRIAFTSDRTGNDEIFVTDADGSNPVNISNYLHGSDDFPSISPDGTKVVFASDRTGTDTTGPYQLYVMDINGDNQTQLTATPSASNADPKWSADGSKIVFESDRDGNGEIYIMDANGDNQTRLTNNSVPDFFPSLSPDNSKVAFISYREGPPELFLKNGNSETRLTIGSTFDSDPGWSPDGTKIVFSSRRNNISSLYTIKPDGTGETRITTDSFNYYSPSWSPDGKWLVCWSDQDLTWQLYTMQADGSNKKNISNNNFYNLYPSWSIKP